MTPEQITALQIAWTAHNWPLIAALVIWLLVRVSKPMKLWERVPVRYQPLVPLALGMISGAAEAVIKGTPWPTALILGLFSGLAPIGGDQVQSRLRMPAPPAPPARLPLPPPIPREDPLSVRPTDRSKS